LIACFLLNFMMGKKAHAQDPHFSQFYNAPMHLSPALTGMMRGDARGTINYRSQWSSIAAPFQTMAASADFRAFSRMTGKDVFGVGLSVLNDVAGQSELQNIQLGVSAAYHKDMTGARNNFIGLGAQYQYVQQSINFAELLFESQFNGEFLDPMQASGENFSVNSFQYYDFSAGISWMYTPTRYQSFYAGASIAHLNRPKVTFYDDLQERLARRYTIYGGADFKVNSNISFIPRGVFLLQGAATEISVGGLLKYSVGETRGSEDQTSIYFGTMHRWQDAQVIILRYDYNDLGFSFAYDVNISKLNISSKGRGAVEFSVIYEGKIFDDNKHDKIICPKF